MKTVTTEFAEFHLDAARKAFEVAAHAGFDALGVRLQERDAEHQRLHEALKDAHMELKTTRADLTRSAAQFEHTLDQLRLEHATTVREQALACTALPLDELLTVFHALSEATTLADVLTGLVNGIAREFSRVALLDVRGNRLEGAQQVGFDFEGDISKIAIPLSVDSLLTRAVSSRRIESVFAGAYNEASGSTPFGGTPACALALPLVVQGATVAVIYADDSDRLEFASAAPQARVKFAEILHQHALLVLLRIWTEQQSLAELGEYVTMLVNEIEYGYTADADAGKNRLECQQRMREALECTRRIYAQRLTREGQSAALLLEERLVAIMETQGESPFARDLAAVFRPVNPAPCVGVIPRDQAVWRA